MRKFVLLALLTPIFWWAISHPKIYIQEWLQTPSYVQTKLTSLANPEITQKLNLMKVHTRLGFFYNPGQTLLDETFNLLTNLSPRIYFQAGDGTALSPSSIGPILAPFMIFWFLGIVSQIKKKNFAWFLLVLAAAFLPYLTGRRNFAFLLPITFIYLYFVKLGIDSLAQKSHENNS